MRLEHLLAGSDLQTGNRNKARKSWTPRSRPCLISLVEYGGLAQLARAPALQAGGQRFESVILHRSLPRRRKENNDMLEVSGVKTSRSEKTQSRKLKPEQRAPTAARREVKEKASRRNNPKMSATTSELITERYKGAWGMPWLSEAKKDVTSCEKPRRGANTH